MNNLELRNAFVHFLTTEKGYPSRSINFEIPIGDQITNRRFLDLALIDPEDKEILAVIELHSSDNPAVVRKAFRRINEAKSIPPLINKNILGFVVVPSDDIFLIFKATYTEKNIGFVHVTKQEFPDFSDLAFKAQVQDRIKQETKEAITLEYSRKRSKLVENYTFAAIIGLFTAISGFYIAYTSPFEDTMSAIVRRKLDSLKTVTRSKGIEVIEKKDSTITNSKETDYNQYELENKLYYNVEKRLHSTIEGRLKNIEEMLSKEPEKTLSILELKSQVSELKALIENKNELYDEKITTIKERADLLSNLTWALTLTVLATLASVVIFYIQSKRS